MSFALEYRKKMQAQARAERARRVALKRENSGYVVQPPEGGEDTRANRRRVLAALSLAAMLLFVFNSGGLVRYTGGLGETRAGQLVVELAERWHGLMEEHRMTAVVDEIRGAVAQARQSRWPDLAAGWSPLSADPATAEEQLAPPTIPTAGEAPQEDEPPVRETAPVGPVLRAAIEELK